MTAAPSHPEWPRLRFVGDLLPADGPGLPALSTGAALVANLECALGSADGCRKAYPVMVGEDALGFLHRGNFAALNLANNHTGDAGPEAFELMCRLLAERTTIQAYGTDDRPYAAVTVGGRRCAIIGCLEPCRSRCRRLFPEEAVAGLLRGIGDQFDRVYVTPHWGKEGEYAHHPSPRQRRLARAWIEAGAAGVLGHHPHTFHGVEQWGGRPIYYSLGNACFDHEEGRQHPLTRFGLAATVEPDRGGAQNDRWTTQLTHGDGREIDEPTQRVLLKLLDEISADLSGDAWGVLRWCRAVGPVYIPKSLKSWGRRLRRDGVRAAVLMGAWLAMPTTLGMMMGCLLPDRRVLRCRQELEQSLLTGKIH